MARNLLLPTPDLQERPLLSKEIELIQPQTRQIQVLTGSMGQLWACLSPTTLSVFQQVHPPIPLLQSMATWSDCPGRMHALSTPSQLSWGSLATPPRGQVPFSHAHPAELKGYQGVCVLDNYLSPQPSLQRGFSLRWRGLTGVPSRDRPGGCRDSPGHRGDGIVHCEVVSTAPSLRPPQPGSMSPQGMTTRTPPTLPIAAPTVG